MADLHKRVLGTLGSVLRGNSIERELAERQILLKDKKSKSRFVYVGPILSQCNHRSLKFGPYITYIASKSKAHSVIT